MKNKRLVHFFCTLSIVPLLCGALLSDCGLNRSDFKRISLNGFDPVDHAQDWNDYPWSMAYFVPDGADQGHVYVGTGNGIDELVMATYGLSEPGESALRPPEIRRYRPDLGEQSWERVFDFRDVDPGPEFTSTGLRYMTAYRNQSDGVNYLYASTFGDVPMVFRSATGDPGSWDLYWTSPSTGSIRWMTPHNGLLYIAIANDVVLEPTPGQIWATDGDTVWSIMEGGFGDRFNRAVTALISYNGWLYAGTANKETGYEVWKLEGPGDQNEPIKVIGQGGTDPRNEVASAFFVFQEKLYIGSAVFAGRRLKGCDLIRIDANGNRDVIVGPNSLSGYDSGFGRFSNAYLWWLEEHDGWLYAGTWDMASVLQMAIDQREFVIERFPDILDAMTNLEGLGQKRDPGIVGTLTQGGCDLYKSRDGVQWSPVFTNGLGDTYNYGIRTMVSVETEAGKPELYLGLANPFDGLEIWRAP